MDSRKNLEKIRQIQENGLLFHAQFRELENRQSVRIFFLTALLSVNVISLIVFVFFASYKMIYSWRDKRVERKAKTKKEDSNVKQQFHTKYGVEAYTMSGYKHP